MLSLSLMECKNTNERKNSSSDLTAEEAIQQVEPKKVEADVRQVEPVESLSIDTVNIYTKFYPSGWMGDGEQGEKYIKYIGASKENPYSGTTCMKIHYIPGTIRWGGFYWQNKPDNWGDKSGEDYSANNYSAIKFYARGQKGGEVVEFKAGGIDAKGKKYKDSFEISLGKAILTKEWKEYKINLTGLDLSCVIGGFCWVVAASDNPEGVTFFLDEITYE